MITALIVVGIVVWGLVAVAVGVVIGQGISLADRSQAKSCCPHPESEAPPTVRGEFRAVIVPLPVERRGTRVDVRS